MVVLSADASPGVVRRLLASGAFAYLTKPIELVELGRLLDTFAATQAQDQPARAGCPDRASMNGPGSGRSPEASVQEPAKRGAVNHAMLYIEDNESNISLVEALLKRRPQIELHVAMTGRDGIQAALDKQPGLILLDNRLPDATGGEILRELASAAATAAIPVVILSSDSDEMIDELLASGAAESVPKPFDIHQFMAVIDRYLPPIALPG